MRPAERVGGIGGWRLPVLFSFQAEDGMRDCKVTGVQTCALPIYAFFSAVTLVSFAPARQSDLTAALRWMMGTLFGATWSDVVLLAALLALAMATLTFVANDLRMLAFGEDDAKSRGVDVERIKLIGFAAGSIITGAAVAVSGIIGFVGLLVPHLIRLIWRRDFRFLLPLCALGGATLVVVADLVSRIVLPS